MFFTLSKTVGLLIEPYYLALFLLGIALLLRLLRRARRLRRALAIFAAVWVALFMTGPVANLLLWPLETKHSRPLALTRPPAAIVMLSGLTSEDVGPGTYYELSDAADRFVEAVRLAHAYPKAQLVLSGGSSNMVDDSYREADVLARLARELGVPSSRLLFDRASRNTRENAVETKRLLAGVKGPVLLVTSAVHMPRSVACFEKIGMKVIPWPVDYQRTTSGPGAWLPKPQTLQRSNAALHEYLGWFVYKVAGYI